MRTETHTARNAPAEALQGTRARTREGAERTERSETTTKKATSDPATSWRQRPAIWTTLDWRTLHESLPGLDIAALTDRHGNPNPVVVATSLVWPRGGALTTAAREAWSGQAVGSTDAHNARRPAAIAEAFARTIQKAARQGVHLTAFQDTLPRVRRTLEPFNVPIRFHQGDIMRAAWNGEPISVYVDDCSKQLPLFCHSVATFGPSWIPGQTVILLMDFDLWKTTGLAEFEFQKRFVEVAGRCFEPMQLDDSASGTVLAAFRYKAPLGAGEWAWLLDQAIDALGAAQRELGVMRLRKEVKDALRLSWKIARSGSLRNVTTGYLELSRRVLAKLRSA